MTTIRKTILALALASVIASSAQAAQTLVAGWDFSQFDPDVMTSQINGTMINQVYSNVSYLDEVDHIIGPNDAGYGMLYYDGQFGSDALIDASNVDSVYLYVSPGVLGGLELEIPEYDSYSTNSADYIAKKLAAGQFQVMEAVIVLLPQDYSGVSEFNLVFSVHVDAGYAGESWTLKYDTLTFGMAAGVEPTETVQIDWACATDPEGTWTPLGTDRIGARATNVHEVPESFDGVSTIYFRVHAVAVSDISHSPMIDNVSIFAEVVEAQASQTLVAGWDFSQYANSGMSIVNDAMVNQLYSNVSYLDTEDHIIGPNDATYGTIYYDGSHGSSALITAENYAEMYFTAGRTLTETALTELFEEYTSTAAMSNAFLDAGQSEYSTNAIAADPADFGVSEYYLVFEAKLDPQATPSAWEIRYDAKTYDVNAPSTTASSIDWACATDTSGTWTTLGTDSIATDTGTYTHTAPSSVDGATTLYFRCRVYNVASLDATPIIDNVSIFAEVDAGPVTFDPTKPFDGVAYDAINRPGYYYSPWFGWYYSQEDWTNWYYQFNGMGWIWTNSAASTEVYFWNPALPFTCWAYTEADAFPWVVVWGAPNVPTDGWYHFNASNNSLTQ